MDTIIKYTNTNETKKKNERSETSVTGGPQMINQLGPAEMFGLASLKYKPHRRYTPMHQWRCGRQQCPAMSPLTCIVN